MTIKHHLPTVGIQPGQESGTGLWMHMRPVQVPAGTLRFIRTFGLGLIMRCRACPPQGALEQ